MATHYDDTLPLARKIVKGLAAKPGVHFVDREIAANFLAQALASAIRSGEIKSGNACGGLWPDDLTMQECRRRYEQQGKLHAINHLRIRLGLEMADARAFVEQVANHESWIRKV
jgi:hypothetical protein